MESSSPFPLTPPLRRPRKRKHPVTTLLDADTLQAFKGLVRRKKVTRSTLLYILIQDAIVRDWGQAQDGSFQHESVFDALPFDRQPSKAS